MLAPLARALVLIALALPFVSRTAAAAPDGKEETRRPIELVVTPRRKPLALRLRAELEALRLAVVMPLAAAAPPGADRARLIVRLRPTAVSLRMESSEHAPGVWSDWVPTAAGKEIDESLVAARAVELVRASLYVAMPTAVAREPGPSDDSREAPVSAPPSDPPASASTSIPLSPDPDPDPAEVARDEAPPSVAAPAPGRTGLAGELAGCLVMSPGGFGASPSLFAAVRFRLGPRIDLLAAGVAPLAHADAEVPAGRLALKAAFAYGGARLVLPVRPLDVEANVEVGLGATWIEVRGEAAAPNTGRAAETLLPAAMVRAGAAFPASSRLRVRADVLTIAPLGRPTVFVLGAEGARWGMPAFAPSIGLEALL